MLSGPVGESSSQRRPACRGTTGMDLGGGQRRDVAGCFVWRRQRAVHSRSDAQAAQRPPERENLVTRVPENAHDVARWSAVVFKHDVAYPALLQGSSSTRENVEFPALGVNLHHADPSRCWLCGQPAEHIVDGFDIDPELPVRPGAFRDHT